jgi:hypothetical protein
MVLSWATAAAGSSNAATVAAPTIIRPKRPRLAKLIWRPPSLAPNRIGAACYLARCAASPTPGDRRNVRFDFATSALTLTSGFEQVDLLVGRQIVISPPASSRKDNLRRSGKSARNRAILLCSNGFFVGLRRMELLPKSPINPVKHPMSIDKSSIHSRA